MAKRKSSKTDGIGCFSLIFGIGLIYGTLSAIGESIGEAFQNGTIYYILVPAAILVLILVIGKCIDTAQENKRILGEMFPHVENAPASNQYMEKVNLEKVKKKHYIRNALIAILISLLFVIIAVNLQRIFPNLTDESYDNIGFLSVLLFFMTSIGSVIYAIANAILERKRKKAAKRQAEFAQSVPLQPTYEEQNYFNVSAYETNPFYDIDYMDGLDFEHWCADLLLQNGFQNAEVTRGSGDQGVDIIAEKDDIRYAIQCKRYSSNLGNTPVQEVSAGKTFYNCQIGLVMTNRYFTQSAIELAKSTGTILWDRDKLMSMAKQNVPENPAPSSEQFEYYCEYLLKRNYYFTRVKSPVKTNDRACDLIGYRKDGTAWAIFCVQDGRFITIEHINKLTAAKSEYHAQCMAIMTSTRIPSGISAYAKEKDVVLFENLTGNIEED